MAHTVICECSGQYEPKSLVLLLGLVAVWSAPPAVMAFDAQKYFPLDIGNHWTFDLTRPFKKGPQTVVRTVTGSSVVRGVTTRTVSISDPTGWLATEYYTNDGAGIRLHRADVDVSEIYEPPIVLASSHFDVGSTETSSGNVFGLPDPFVNMSYSATSRVEARERVTTPLGDFDAVRIRLVGLTWGTLDLSIFKRSISWSWSNIYWLSEFIGPVRREDLGEDSGLLSQHLTAVFVDSDQDGLNVTDEMTLGTDPLSPDSDTDGINDGDEVSSNRNPLVNEGAVGAIINSILLE